MTELLRFPRLDLILGLAILVVLAVRGIVARRLGGGAAYALWLLVPFSAAAAFLPARVIEVAVESDAIGAAAPTDSGVAGVGEALLPTPFWFEAIDIGAVLLAVWLVGVAISLGLLLLRQRRFLRRLEPLSPVASDGRLHRAARNDAGPALVGFFAPKIVVPADFETRYSQAERQVMVTHETTHLERSDVRINTLVAIVQCVLWYNPLIHIAAHCLRIDQELACDEAVVARHPTERRVYAETLLKTQTTRADLPIGCHWPTRSTGPLHSRISLLAQPPKGPFLRTLGASGAALMALVAGAAVWAAQPPTYSYASPSSRTLSVNRITLGDGTPLIRAVAEGDLAEVRRLLDAGADPNLAAPGDGNPLIAAAASGNIEIARALIAAGAKVNGYVPGDETPLINAVREDQAQMVRVLVENGADVNLAVRAEEDDGSEMRSALREAEQAGLTRIADYLRSKGARR